MADLEQSWKEDVRHRLMRTGNVLSAWATSPWSRVAVIVIFIGLALIISYSRVLAPLAQQPDLPPGVAPTNPKLSVELLRVIDKQRIERIEKTGEVFLVGQLFVPGQAR